MLSEQPVLAPHGMVVCAHELATQTSTQLLTQSGDTLFQAACQTGLSEVLVPLHAHVLKRGFRTCEVTYVEHILSEMGLNMPTLKQPLRSLQGGKQPVI